MIGCLTAPVRALGCLVLVGSAALAWLYRDRLTEAITRVVRAETGSVPGRPGTRALASARAKSDSLAAGRADSVVLGAAEVASLIGAGLPTSVRGRLDSLEVRLLNGAVEVGAVVPVRDLGPGLIGPLAAALRGRERVRFAGGVEVVAPGQGVWAVERMDVGDVPVPKDLVAPLLRRALGSEARPTSVPVRVPRGVRAIRIRPSGAVLIGVR